MASLPKNEKNPKPLRQGLQPATVGEGGIAAAAPVPGQPLKPGKRAGAGGANRQPRDRGNHKAKK